MPSSPSPATAGSPSSRRVSLPFAALLAAAAAALPACSGAPDDGDVSTTEAASTAAFPAAAKAKWDAYVARATAGARIQRGCEPTRFSPPAGVATRGAVVLFHGYSACPQQYFELSQSLTAAGFEVLLPLTPGHGREPLRRADGTITDDVSDLPNGYTKGRYADFAREMNGVLAEVPGVRVVGGLSLGGAIATQAMLDAPSLYTRGLLLSPFYTIPGVQGWLAKAANVVVPAREAGWGPNCVAEREQPNPRAGICEFQVQHVRGAAEFGEQVAAQAKRLTLPVQIAGVDQDGAADNGLTMKVARAAKDASLCFYPQGVNHSLLSRFDSPFEDKYWVPSALEQVSAFITTGRRFVTEGTSREDGFPLCAVR